MSSMSVPDDDQSLIEVVPGDSPVASASLDEMVGWQSYFIRHFIRRPGQHLLEIGKTGTGKTQFLYWMVDLLREYSPDEAIVWFDIGKGEEILALIEFFGRRRGEPVTICTLPGCEIEIEYDAESEVDIEFVTVAHCREVWQHIKPGRLLIACFEPFIEDPVLAVKETADMFSELSHLAHRRQIYAPTAIIYDEFHNVCPSQGYGYAISGKESRIQSQSISLIRRNVQKLRSQGLRIIATTHQWTQMNRGVRASFEWIVPRRGTLFSSDDERLRAFNPLWRKLKTNECYIVLPDGQFSSSLRLPFYEDGRKLGKIWYGGIYESVSEKQE